MMGMQMAPAQLFYDFCLDDHVPDDHLLRRIDRFLDLEKVRTELRPFYSSIGRPSIDPELMMRMLIVGYCMGIRPGASHLTTGLYDALMDHQPVLAIVGQQARNALGGQYQQELDLVSMFKDVAGAYVVQASSPAQVRHLIDRAARIALSRRTVTAIILPN
jgi:Thiamine pyrophosphate enzyme, N-terminal TPP binding domain